MLSVFDQFRRKITPGVTGPKTHYEVRWTDGDTIKYLTHPHIFMSAGADKREERTLSSSSGAAEHFRTRALARKANKNMDWCKHGGRSYIVCVRTEERIIK
jgi:hypothetical protein